MTRLALVFALVALPAAAQTPKPVTVPTAEQATPVIKAACAKKFPTDFSTQVFCVNQQTAARGKLQARAMTSADQQTIRQGCGAKFPADFQTWNFCEERQLKALATLRK